MGVAVDAALGVAGGRRGAVLPEGAGRGVTERNEGTSAIALATALVAGGVGSAAGWVLASATGGDGLTGAVAVRGYTEAAPLGAGAGAPCRFIANVAPKTTATSARTNAMSFLVTPPWNERAASVDTPKPPFVLGRPLMRGA